MAETQNMASGRSSRGCLLMAGKYLLGILIAVTVFCLAGSLYETSARQEELKKVQEPGMHVDIGGRSLHILCQGVKQPGKPTVILEAGAGGWSLHWYSFLQQAAQFARVCAYDRAGFGWSDPGPAPRDGLHIASDLNALLSAAGETGPYLLVGASRGAQYIRLFRDAYPRDVVGMVFVDGEPEDFRSSSPFVASQAAQNQAVFSAVGFLSRVGAFRLLGIDSSSAPELPCVPFAVKYLPVEMHAAYLAVEGQPKCFDALLAEETATIDRENQVRLTHALGDLPLVVLTHGIPGGATVGASPEQAAELEAAWQSLQVQLSGLSSRGILITAEHSGHNIALDQPDVVLDAILKVLEMK